MTVPGERVSVAIQAAPPLRPTTLKKLLLGRAPSNSLRLMRAIRMLAFSMLEPLDYCTRVINQKRHLPPLHLRREVGDLGTFETSGGEFAAYCKLLGGLQSHHQMLDIGCGCGLLALELETYLGTSGRYTGIDVQNEPLRWCRAHISERLPNFQFRQLNVWNGRYNAAQGQRDGGWELPFEPNSFDFVVAKSVLTHLLPQDFERYLQEIARVIRRPTGRALLSVFLFDPQVSSGAAHLRFRFGDDQFRYVSVRSPESAVACAEQHMRKLVDASGLRVIEPIHFGAWSGRSDGLSFQDLVVLSPA